MKKLRLLSLVGITSIALSHAAWAGPHGGGGGGFGGARFSGGRPHFAGRTGMSGVRPPVFSRPGRITNSRPALSNVARNRGAISSSARPSRTVSQHGLNVNGRTDHIAERHDSNWHGDWDRRHAHFD